MHVHVCVCVCVRERHKCTVFTTSTYHINSVCSNQPHIQCSSIDYRDYIYISSSIIYHGSSLHLSVARCYQHTYMDNKLTAVKHFER